MYQQSTVLKKIGKTADFSSFVVGSVYQVSEDVAACLRRPIREKFGDMYSEIPKIDYITSTNTNVSNSDSDNGSPSKLYNIDVYYESESELEADNCTSTEILANKINILSPSTENTKYINNSYKSNNSPDLILAPIPTSPQTSKIYPITNPALDPTIIKLQADDCTNKQKKSFNQAKDKDAKLWKELESLGTVLLFLLKMFDLGEFLHL